MRRHELTDTDWARLKELLPPERGRPGRPAELSNRRFMDGIIFIAKTGLPWRDLPERFGPWKTVHSRFTRWNTRGVFERVLNAFAIDADNESSMADSTCVRAHQHAAGGKGGPKVSVLDALAEALQPRSTLSWTVSVIQPTSILRRETSTTSSKRQRSSKPRAAITSSPTKDTIPMQSSPRSEPRE